ncbi:Glycoside hydrolase superfamily [Penicillium sp. IBT 18751x]|nr:Glycoside hydrolase superfamily [Penicillium sp. IBT 18751x]
MVSFTALFTSGLVATAALAAPLNHVKRDSTTSSSKRGAAYNDISTVSLLSSAGTISWAYNWGFSSFGSLPSNVEYVPMLWGAQYFTGWVAAIETALASGSDYILGFNEPDMASQADMTPAAAASYYNQYITPYSGQAKLISPSVTSSTASGAGLSWFTEFMGDCSSCGLTGLAVHWYGDTADEFQSFITQAITTAQEYSLTEVWITEFSLNADVNGISDPSATAAFLDTVQPWLDSQSMVTRYSYFYCADGYLLSDGTVNAAGEAYISASN